MSYTKKIRIEYYQVVKNTKDSKGKEELFSLEKLIAFAKTKKIEERAYKYYDEEARLDRIHYDADRNYWYLNFVRLRQTKIPVKAKKTEEAQPIKLAFDEYIGEDLTAIYDCSNNILVLQRNRDSLSVPGIEEYLNNLYNNETYAIFLRPISCNIQERIDKINSVRKITMKFASDLHETKKGIVKSSFNELINYFSNFASKRAIVSISLGRQRRGSLDLQKIIQTIDDIRNTEGVVDAAELSVKYSDDGPVDIIDLFAMKQYDFITIKIERLKSIMYEDIREEIRKKYDMNKERILSGLKE